LKIWFVEIKEIKRNALTSVFTNYHFQAENFDEAKSKADSKLKEEYPTLELEITKIEELFDIDG